MDNLLHRKQVKEILGIKSNHTLASYIANRSFPPPSRHLTPRTPVWRKRDIEKWMASRSS
jgi:predicted DNA-binding transcriptional regulator AlpA